MGYPPYFILALGISKVLGSVVLLTPKLKRWKEWAFAGFTFDVIFASYRGSLLIIIATVQNLRSYFPF